MGANMMPIEKNRGSTVFGVRMGLVNRSQRSAGFLKGDATLAVGVVAAYCHAFSRCCRNAVSV